MNETLAKIRDLVCQGTYLVSSHAYDELLDDRISAQDILESLVGAEVIEDYPNAIRGSSVLVLQHDRDGPIHTVWGIPRSFSEQAVLITAYRPDPDRWSSDFRKRRA